MLIHHPACRQPMGLLKNNGKITEYSIFLKARYICQQPHLCWDLRTITLALIVLACWMSVIPSSFLNGSKMIFSTFADSLPSFLTCTKSGEVRCDAAKPNVCCKFSFHPRPVILWSGNSCFTSLGSYDSVHCCSALFQ